MNNKCLGCGITLQNIDVNKDGYVSSKDYSLCERCFRIKYYNENKKIINVNENDLFKAISADDMVVYVSSLLTLNLDYIDKFKNAFLVLTKRDVIPKSVKDNKIINYVKEKYHIDNVIIVSANKKKNLDILYNYLLKNGSDKKIYFVGETNSGKSTLINELINSYTSNVGKITTSSFPNTTIDLMEIKLNDLVIYDTPGIVNEKSIINVLNNDELKKINSKKEIKPITFQISGSGSIMISNLCRLDYVTNSSSLTFYVSNNLMVKGISLNNNAFKNDKTVEYDNLIKKDIVISDIGFIKVTNNTSIKIKYKEVLDVRIRDNLI